MPPPSMPREGRRAGSECFWDAVWIPFITPSGFGLFRFSRGNYRCDCARPRSRFGRLRGRGSSRAEGRETIPARLFPRSAFARAVEALETVRDAYAAVGVDTLVYKAVPHVYHRRPSADDVYALHRLGARLVRCDLSCALDVAARRASPGGRGR